MRSIAVLPEADIDFQHIYEHYAYERGVPYVADRIDLGIRTAIENNLLMHPGIGRKVASSLSGLRALLVGKNHWVLYTHDDEVVYIHRIIAAKELTTWDDK